MPGIKEPVTVSPFTYLVYEHWHSSTLLALSTSQSVSLLLPQIKPVYIYLFLLSYFVNHSQDMKRNILTEMDLKQVSRQKSEYNFWLICWSHLDTVLLLLTLCFLEKWFCYMDLYFVYFHFPLHHSTLLLVISRMSSSS